MPGRVEARLLQGIGVALGLVDGDMRPDQRRIGEICGGAVGPKGGQHRNGVAAVAENLQPGRRAERATIADIAILAADIAVRITPALRVIEIAFERQMFGCVPFHVAANGVGLQHFGVDCRGEVGW
ncbi:hypothetical protein D9M73_128930 [compost metagenome]